MKLAIVDDNEIEQEIILNTLDVYSKEHSVHFEIETFSDGGSFLGAYQSVDYDLVFMDIFLADQNGIDIVRKIRQTDSKVLIVFLTTSADHIFEAAPFHFFDYILKPFEYKQISHVLDEASRSCLRVKLNLLLNIVILMFIFLCQRFSIFIQIIMKSLSIPVMAARHSVFLFILLQRILMIHAFYSVTVESC